MRKRRFFLAQKHRKVTIFAKSEKTTASDGVFSYITVKTAFVLPF